MVCGKNRLFCDLCMYNIYIYCIYKYVCVYLHIILHMAMCPPLSRSSVVPAHEHR